MECVALVANNFLGTQKRRIVQSTSIRNMVSEDSVAQGSANAGSDDDDDDDDDDDYDYDGVDAATAASNSERDMTSDGDDRPVAQRATNDDDIANAVAAAAAAIAATDSDSISDDDGQPGTSNSGSSTSEDKDSLDALTLQDRIDDSLAVCAQCMSQHTHVAVVTVVQTLTLCLLYGVGHIHRQGRYRKDS